MEIVGHSRGRRAPDRQPNPDPQRLAGLHGACRPLQRPGTLHGDHRFRVDRDRRLQPAPQRALPRRRRCRQPDAAVLAVSTARTPRTSGPIWRRFEAKTGSDVLAIPHNGNLSQRPDVHRRELRRRAADRGTGGPAHPVRAADRGHPDQGRRRIASVPVAERRVRGLRDLGPLEPQRHRGEDPGHAEIRVCPRGAEDRPEAGERARRQSLQVRHDRLDRLRTPRSPPPRRTTSSASIPASSPSRIAGTMS